MKKTATTIRRQTNDSLLIYAVATYILIVILCSFVTYRIAKKLRPSDSQKVSIEEIAKTLLAQTRALNATTRSQVERSKENDEQLDVAKSRIDRALNTREEREKDLTQIETKVKTLKGDITKQNDNFLKLRQINDRLNGTMDETDDRINDLLYDVTSTSTRLDNGIEELEGLSNRVNDELVDENYYSTKAEELSNETKKQTEQIEELRQKINTIGEPDAKLKDKFSEAEDNSFVVKTYTKNEIEAPVFQSIIRIEIMSMVGSTIYESVEKALDKVNEIWQYVDESTVICFEIEVKDTAKTLTNKKLTRTFINETYGKYHVNSVYQVIRQRKTETALITLLLYVEKRYYAEMQKIDVSHDPNDTKQTFIYLYYALDTKITANTKNRFVVIFHSLDENDATGGETMKPEIEEKLKNITNEYGHDDEKTEFALFTPYFKSYGAKQKFLRDINTERKEQGKNIRLVYTNGETIETGRTYAGTLPLRVIHATNIVDKPEKQRINVDFRIGIELNFEEYF